jgi:hypothetical protein
MVAEKGRYVWIDLSKRTWEMAIIRRTGKFKTNGQGDGEPEEETAVYNGSTTVGGRLKLYGKLGAGDKVALEAGNLVFIMAEELKKAVGCQVRVLNAHHLLIIYATDKEDALRNCLKKTTTHRIETMIYFPAWNPTRSLKRNILPCGNTWMNGPGGFGRLPKHER